MSLKFNSKPTIKNKLIYGFHYLCFIHANIFSWFRVFIFMITQDEKDYFILFYSVRFLVPTGMKI